MILAAVVDCSHYSHFIVTICKKNYIISISRYINEYCWRKDAVLTSTSVFISKKSVSFLYINLNVGKIPLYDFE